MTERHSFHGLMRNVRVSPWTRRSLTASLLLGRAGSAAGVDARKPRAVLSPSAALAFHAWEASVAARLHKDKDV
jgi:hypothetical protein